MSNTKKHKKKIKKTGIEIRRFDNGNIDEVLLYINDKCVFHLETMDNGHIWMGLYEPEEKAVHHVNLLSKRKIDIAVLENA